MSGTEVTCRDVETGETETATIRDDYVVITDGRMYVDGLVAYPKSGTVVVTIKRRPVVPETGNEQ
jgi:hypothetical protein